MLNSNPFLWWSTVVVFVLVFLCLSHPAPTARSDVLATYRDPWREGMCPWTTSWKPAPCSPWAYTLASWLGSSWNPTLSMLDRRPLKPRPRADGSCSSSSCFYGNQIFTSYISSPLFFLSSPLLQGFIGIPGLFGLPGPDGERVSCCQMCIFSQSIHWLMTLLDDNSVTSLAVSFSCLVVVTMRKTVPSCPRYCCIRLCGCADDSHDKSPLLEPLNCLNSSRPPPSVQPLKHEAISLLMTCSRGLRQRTG